MTADDLCYTPATTLRELIANRQVSPTEVVDAILARIERLEPTLNAFATLTPELARDAARAAEEAVMRGRTLGPLHGIPVTLKDLTATAGIPTQRGSLSCAGEVPSHDAPVATRLKEAGAVILGKTTTSEFGWTAVSRSPLTGFTSNPWRPGFNAGASSAGAGVGAAAGYGPLHQGSDGAGSIRIPAHFCGVFGMKGTYGRVPYWPPPNNDQTSHIGPLTRTVADAALMLKVLAGHHTLDHLSSGAPVPDYPALLGGDITGMRIAYSPDLGHARVDPDVAGLVRTAVDKFVDMGCRVEEVAIPFAKDGPALARFFWSAHELNHLERLPEWAAKMDPGLVACIRDAEHYTAADYLGMRQRKLNYVGEWHRFFESWDLLLTPAVSVAAFPADSLQPPDWPAHPWDWIMWAEFSYPFNLCGLPAASVPCGLTPDDLPVALQVVGRRFDEASVFQASAAFERIAPWAHRRPTL
jgi:aspartyl-tRNA(Asn)/glutamyl-tRNA(Gln) amidotransferase subunit A